MVVSEKHGLIIIAMGSELQVFEFNPLTLSLNSEKCVKKISLDNDNVRFKHFYCIFSMR